MAAPRGEAAGRRDDGNPRGAVAGECPRFPAPVGRASSAPVGCGAAGPEWGVAHQELVEPHLAERARAPLVRAVGVVTLPRRLSSPRWTLRGGHFGGSGPRLPRQAGGGRELSSDGPGLRRTRRSVGAPVATGSASPAGDRTVLPGPGHRCCGLFCASCLKVLRGLRACSGCRA